MYVFKSAMEFLKFNLTKICSNRPDHIITQPFSIEHLANGFYFMEIIYDTGTDRGKFIKLKINSGPIFSLPVWRELRAF